MCQILSVHKVHTSGNLLNGLLLAGKTELTDLLGRLAYSESPFYTLGDAGRINA